MASLTLVLVAALAPVSFLRGLSSELYRQFAVTIAISVVVSGIVALTFTPAMCALLIDKVARPVEAPFRVFNPGFEQVTRGFVGGVGFLLDRVWLGVALFAGVVAVLLLLRMPARLVPKEDQGVALVVGQLPATTSLQRTEKVRDALTGALLSCEEIEEFTSFAGFDIIAGSLRMNAIVGFAKLTDWRERTGEGQDAASITGRIMGLGFGIQEANVPRYRAEIDRDQARALGVPVNAVFEAMQSTFGSVDPAVGGGHGRPLRRARRRARRAEQGRWNECARGGNGGSQAAVSRHHDDCADLHHRLVAAGVCHGRGGGQTPRDRHRGRRRHDRRQHARAAVRAAVLQAA